MPRVKRRTFCGCVCEQEIFNVAENRKDIENAKPIERFKTEEERERHRVLQSRRHHANIINANFSPRSLYSTLTFSNKYEVHTFEEARYVRDLFVRRLKYAYPDAVITIYMGRGERTKRIHFHMISDGIPEEEICRKWTDGEINRIEHLREHNYYDGIDHGQDYTGLANYLFNHWTPEQGRHRWKQTRNIKQPEKETPTIIKRNYTEDKPPQPPKGFVLVESKSNSFGYLYFKYVKIPEPKKRSRKC